MGRQVTFFLHPDDQKDFDTLLKSFGEVQILSYYHYDNKISTVDDTLIKGLGKQANRVYLVRPQDFELMKLSHIEKFGYWLLKDNELPVLHFDRCSFDGNELHQGRLYFQPRYAESMQIVNKSEDFIKWADSIIKVVRRKLKKHKFDMDGWDYTDHVGKNALNWIESNNPKSCGGGSSLKI
ncbi:hypothetical protein [Chitinophaga arvensicola]|uniref:Uncharacterized protein n=1 Tax=Chitinophaga arvensicola TaxID=29529 RepID=A0A1I0S7T1_9BACT|nr:hypothetical protein [Chitinophaga arvensicola]SEW51876.1 hypothetical protein SAMN04488122_4559 [Chitinophaga arvensicola]